MSSALQQAPRVARAVRRRVWRRREATRDEFAIRPAHNGDVAAIESIARRTWAGRDFLVGTVAEWIDDPAGQVFVAETPARLLGAVKLVHVAPQQWWLEGCRVDPDHRTLGAGRALVRHGVARVAEAEAERGTVGGIVNDANTPMLRILSGLGFRERARVAVCETAAGRARVGEFQVLGSSDVAAACALIAASRLVPAEIWRDGTRPVAVALDEDRVRALVAAERLFGWYGVRRDAGLLDGLLAIGGGDTGAGRGDIVELSWLDALSDFDRMAAAVPALVASLGARSVAHLLQASPDRVAAIEAAGWRRARGLTQSVLVELALDERPSGPPSKAVAAQQVRLNELLGNFGFPALTVDGVDGSRTRQAAGAARLVTNSSRRNVRRAHRRRWALIDASWQVLLAGERDGTIRFAFPTSTGGPASPTRPSVDRAAFRYEPALRRGGWHNSSEHPVRPGDPRGGNMYRPVYFDDGIAIHGALDVPTFPGSYGCVRLATSHQDELVAWLGLDDASATVWDPGVINLSVTVRGSYSWSR